MPQREYRVTPHAQIRAKKNGDKQVIDGYAAVFNQLSVNLGWYRERIKPGAFADCLATSPDVRCLFNHDPSLLLGRTKNETLRLKEDNTGLHFEADPPDTNAARDVMTLIERRDVDQCSFGFYVTDAEWTQEPDPDNSKNLILVRNINKAEVFDTSPVTYPAYEGTSVDLRGSIAKLWPGGIPEDVRSHIPDLETRAKGADECDCNCAACQDGECDECSNKDCDSEECAGCPMQSNAGGDEEDEGRALRAATGSKTKRVDGEDLTADCFAWVGDKEKTASWKLPIKFSTEAKTKRHIRNALARFSGTKGISAEEKPKVWKRITAAAKKHGIKVSEEDSVRAGFPPTPAGEIERMKMRVRLAKASE